MILVLSITILAIISTATTIHVISVDSDAIGYTSAFNVLIGESFDAQLAPSDFVIHRILTTFLGIGIMGIFSIVFGSSAIGWMIWNIILYIIVNIIFYKLLLAMFKNPITALLGTLFFASNYALITSGLGYFMDIGGWTFYILSIYFLFSYIKSRERRNIWLAALFIGVGGFFKENALFAYIPFFSIMFYESRFSFRLMVKNIFLPSLVIFFPLLIHHLNVYMAYGHSYLYWVKLNQAVYVYPSRLIEYIKNFGSLLGFLTPLSLAGLAVIFSTTKKLSSEFELDKERIVFIVSILASSIPAVLWPGITQRVLFMVVPGLVIISCFFIHRYNKHWRWIVVLLFLYIISNFLMDPFILKTINIPL